MHFLQNIPVCLSRLRCCIFYCSIQFVTSFLDFQPPSALQLLYIYSLCLFYYFIGNDFVLFFPLQLHKYSYVVNISFFFLLFRLHALCILNKLNQNIVSVCAVCVLKKKKKNIPRCELYRHREKEKNVAKKIKHIQEKPIANGSTNESSWNRITVSFKHCSFLKSKMDRNPTVNTLLCVRCELVDVD